MARGSSRSAAAGSIIGGHQYHLSIPYVRSRLQTSGSRRFARPPAQQLRAGLARGHPRPGGRESDEPVPPPSPGTQPFRWSRD